MTSETKTTDIHISDIMFWVVLFIFLAVMAWWVLGDSPTTEIMGITLSATGLFAAWRGSEEIKIIKENIFKTLELQQKMLERLER